MRKTFISGLNTAANLTNLAETYSVGEKVLTSIKNKHSIPQDTFGRTHNYLRISLTERCNLRCTYCMPEQGVKLTQNEKLLTSSEIVSLVRLFVRNGVNKVRFTGGEPLVRKDCVDIIKQVGKIDGLEKIAMTTNGILLSRRIKELIENGLSQVNISLDTLEEKKFEFISKRKGFTKVMDSINAALDHELTPLKVNQLFENQSFKLLKI